MSARCPECGGPLPEPAPAAPFCSPRCRLVDLGRWLGEEYRLPAVEAEGPAEEAPEARRWPRPGSREVPT